MVMVTSFLGGEHHKKMDPENLDPTWNSIGSKNWCEFKERIEAAAPSKVVRGQCTVFGGGSTDQGGEAAVHRFITQQPTLFLAEWGVMRGNKRGNERGKERGERRQERREAKRDQRGMA